VPEGLQRLDRDDGTVGRLDAVARLGGVGWLVVIAMEIVAFGLWARTGYATPDYVFMRGPAPLIALFAGVVAQASAGAILVRRRPDNRVGWTIMAFALVSAWALVVITATADPLGRQTLLVRWAAWTSALAFPAASFLAFALAFVFPDGQLLSRRWRPMFALVSAACLIAAALIALRPGPMLFFPSIDNAAVAQLAVPPADWHAVGALVLLAAAGLLAGTALFTRYRRSDGILRVQVRWYIVAGVILATTYSAQLIAMLLWLPRDPRGELIETVNHLALGIPPIAMAMAILRYRLYDIDELVSRAFVYGALTAILAGMYAASIRLFNGLFTAITGQSDEAALVITTLLLATTFTPIKGRLERFASSRLGRSRHGLEPPSVGGGHEPAAEAATPPASSYLDDPAFVSAVDARVRAALEDPGRAAPARASRGASDGGVNEPGASRER
jgi:hypothetical protein